MALADEPGSKLLLKELGSSDSFEGIGVLNIGLVGFLNDESDDGSCRLHACP